jgi:hypothetical protein
MEVAAFMEAGTMFMFRYGFKEWAEVSVVRFHRGGSNEVVSFAVFKALIFVQCACSVVVVLLTFYWGLFTAASER